MSMFKHVRIVHSPRERRYTVEERGIFTWGWNRVTEYDYVELRNSSPHGTHDFAGDALAKAKAKAETLLAKSVVWQGSNFTWGP